jgi:hypothetical protein
MYYTVSGTISPYFGCTHTIPTLAIAVLPNSPRTTIYQSHLSPTSRTCKHHNPSIPHPSNPPSHVSQPDSPSSPLPSKVLGYPCPITRKRIRILHPFLASILTHMRHPKRAAHNHTRSPCISTICAVCSNLPLTKGASGVEPSASTIPALRFTCTQSKLLSASTSHSILKCRGPPASRRNGDRLG